MSHCEGDTKVKAQLLTPQGAFYSSCGKRDTKKKKINSADPLWAQDAVNGFII